jgi:hypothetical protein
MVMFSFSTLIRAKKSAPLLQRIIKARSEPVISVSAVQLGQDRREIVHVMRLWEMYA